MITLMLVQCMLKFCELFFQKYIFFNSLLMGLDLMFFFSNISYDIYIKRSMCVH
jgi:hypothetical protein